MTGVIVVLVIAFLVLGAILLGRRDVKKPDEDEGVNASSELTPHDPGHVGRVEPSDRENRGTTV